MHIADNNKRASRDENMHFVTKIHPIALHYNYMMIHDEPHYV